MWKALNTETVGALPEAVWKLWSGVERWPEQDDSLVSASINGPFETGSIITLKPKGSPTVKVILTKVVPNDSFESIGKLPLAKLHFVHTIQTTGSQTSFTQSVALTGPLSGLFTVFMGKKMEQNLKARMAKMVKLLENS